LWAIASSSYVAARVLNQIGFENVETAETGAKASEKAQRK